MAPTSIRRVVYVNFVAFTFREDRGFFICADPELLGFCVLIRSGQGGRKNEVAPIAWRSVSSAKNAELKSTPGT